MFDPYVVVDGTKVETHRMDAFQIEDAFRKLARRNLTLRLDSPGHGTIVKK